MQVEPINWDSSRWRSEGERFDDRTVFQSPEWMKFLAETQGGDPVVLALHEGCALVSGKKESSVTALLA